MIHVPDDQWHQLWGTFSVRDHRRPGGFIPEVLIYDRLVLPVVPSADDLADEARQLGQDAKALAASEWQRWETARWDPARQRRVVELLEKHDRVERIPWTFARQAAWAASMKREFADARRNGFFMTGSELAHLAPPMARAVVAVPQYESLEALENAERMHRLDRHDRLPAGQLLAVLGHELLLPGDPVEDDFRHLEEALEVSADPVYRERRRALYDWQQQFVRGEQTDARSIKAAVEEMRQLVHELQTATSRQKRWVWGKRIFTVMGAATAVGAALVDPSLVMWPTAAGAAATVGSLVADELMPKTPAGVPAATLVLEARSALGLV